MKRFTTSPVKLVLLALALALQPLPAAVETLPPLEFKAVVELFTKMLEVKPKPLHPQCVIFGLGERYRRDDHVESVVIVTEDPPRLAVSFLVSGGYGMNFVSEFFEAPFFKRSESEEFYALLHGPAGHSLAQFPRFSVEFDRVQTPEWHFISLSFGLPAAATPLP